MYYIVFVVFSAGLFGVVWGFFPETRGYSLGRIAMVFKCDWAAVMDTIPEIAGKGVGRGNVHVEETKTG
jgi:hypothetical protein